jgi:hypothetical protein
VDAVPALPGERSGGDAPMIAASWPFLDPRKNRQKVMGLVYLISRMGWFHAADGYFLFFRSLTTARLYLADLAKKGILETAPRRNEADPHAFRISARAAEWLIDEAGCEPDEIVRPASLTSVNVPALRARNRFWCSLVAAARATSGVTIKQFVAERQLRALKTSDVTVIPDAAVILEVAGEAGPDQGEDAAPHVLAYFAELDGGTERQKIWTEKFLGYGSARRQGSLYGLTDWRLLALLPSQRRAVHVARTAVASGGAEFTILAVSSSLERGHAFDRVVWNAVALAEDERAEPTVSLLGPGAERPASATANRPAGGSE